MGKTLPGRYGKIMLVEQVASDKWLALCDCGREFETRGRAVVRGEIKTCGCRTGWHPEIGYRVGSIMVIDNSLDMRMDWQASKNRKAALCKCDCGKEFKLPTYRLYNKLTSGCQACNMTKFSRRDAAINSLRGRYKRQAETRGYSFELDREQFIDLIFNDCYYSGHPPVQVTIYKGYDLLYNGVDRKNNKLGYTVENSVACCGICNRAKSGMDYDAWIQWLKAFKAQGPDSALGSLVHLDVLTTEEV